MGILFQPTLCMDSFDAKSSEIFLMFYHREKQSTIKKELK